MDANRLRAMKFFAIIREAFWEFGIENGCLVPSDENDVNGPHWQEERESLREYVLDTNSDEQLADFVKKLTWLAEYLFAPRAPGMDEATVAVAVATVAAEIIAPCTPPSWSSPSSLPELHSAFASPAAAALCFSGPSGLESPLPGPAHCPPLGKGLSSAYSVTSMLSSASILCCRSGYSAAVAAHAAQQQSGASALERSRPSIPNLESVCTEERDTLCLEWLTRPNRGWNDTITLEDYAKFQSRSRPQVPVLPMPDTRLLLGESLEMVPSYGERPNSSRGTCPSSNAECSTSGTSSGTSSGSSGTCCSSGSGSFGDSSDGAACTVNKSIVMCPGGCGFPAGWACHCGCNFSLEIADEPLASPSSHDLPAPWDIPTAPLAGGPVLFFGQCAPPAMEPELERGLELTASSSSASCASSSSSCSAAWCELEPRQQQPAPEVTEGEVMSATHSEQPCDYVCEAQQQPQPQRHARTGSQVPGYLRHTASSSVKAGERRRLQWRRS